MLTGVCWWENSRLEEVQHSHLKLKYSPVLRSTLLGKGMCWICVIKWGDHTSSVFPYRSYFHVVIAKCTPWHTLPALLLNLEHGKGRWFPLQWHRMGGPVDAKDHWVMSSLVSLMVSVTCCGNQGHLTRICEWPALTSHRQLLPRQAFSVFGAWLVPCPAIECPTWQSCEQNCKGAHQSWRDA